jgi:hypothetical protein
MQLDKLEKRVKASIVKERLALSKQRLKKAHQTQGG